MTARLLRALLAAVAAAVALVAVPGAPAYACSCVGDTRDFVGWADVVVVGTVVGRHGEGNFLGDGTVTYTVEVDTVYEGDATSSTEVVSSGSGAACGLEGIEVGTRYVVFASHERDGELWASLCGGTAPASDRMVGKVQEVLGEGEPPAPGGPIVPGEGWSWLAAWVDRVLDRMLG